jgi:hypothetical protein
MGMNATTNAAPAALEPIDPSTVHPWERAGLGKAPFFYLGVSEKRGPIVIEQRDGTTLTIGSEGQPMGSCAYCGLGIAECHHVRSSDGKKFTVGCDCIRRVYGDDRAPVRAKAEAASRKLRNAAAKARRAAKSTTEQAELDALLADEGTRAKLAALPGPRFGTLLEHAEFMARKAGAAGRARALKAIRAAL